MAQQSAYTYIFQITADEAEQLYQRTEEELYSEPYLYNLIDSFQQQLPVLAPGHYLLVSAEKEKLRIEQKSVHHHAVQSIKNGNQLSLIVLSAENERITNANVYFSDNRMYWQQSKDAYSIKRIRSDGWLRVEVASDTLFYQVDHDKIKPQRRRFFTTPIGYIIGSPYRWAKHTYHFFKRGIGRGDWYIRHRRFWPFRMRDRSFKGYTALSQPTYRPGDTLKVKTYLTKQNGRPWKKPILMELSGGRRYQKYLKRELSPDRSGAFTTEIVLADSLQLDQSYTLTFRVPNKNKYGSKTQRFKLEDYQLDAATFELELSATNYQAGEPILITAKGRDENNNPLPNAQVELIVLRQSVMDIAKDSLLIPDTIWQHQQPLSLREDSKIRLPDSLLPPAVIDLKVEAFFATAGGESTKKTAGFRYDYQLGKVDHSLENGKWSLRYLEKDSSVAQNMYLSTYRTIPPFKKVDTIHLPCQWKVEPYVQSYQLHMDSLLKHTILLNQEKSGVQLVGQLQHDSLRLTILNPHDLLIHYQIYEGTKLWKEGVLQTTSDLTFDANIQQQYTVHYSYTWAGARQSMERSFRAYKRQLLLEAELPQQIFPGQSVQVKIKASDSKQRPAKGVEMVAGAVNGQFDSKAHLSPPQVTYKRRKGFRAKHSFSLREPEHTHYSTISRERYQTMQLDSMLYYKIRYPEGGVFEQRDTILEDSFYLKYPQVSPYVVANHQLQPIYLIYLNRELVYSHYNQAEQVYAFNGRPGYNQLRLRTRTAEYQIDSVYLHPGQKLSIAIDEKAFGVHPIYGSRIKRIRTEKELSEAEKTRLNDRMIQIRKEERQSVSYLYPDSTQIYRWEKTYRRGNTRLVGPVPPNRRLTYLQRDGLQNTFLHEPGYIYEIREGRERLYRYNFFTTEQTYELPLALPHPKVDQLALLPSDILANSPTKKKINFRNNSLVYHSRGSDLQILYDSKNDSTLVAVSLQNSNGKYSVLRGDQRYFKDLASGYYELSLISQEGYVSSRKCWLYANQLLVLDMRQTEFVRDTSRVIFDELYSFETEKPSFITHRSSGNIHKSANNPYQNIGYLATGILTDENGEPLIGVSILLVGSQIGTVTNLDGEWELWVPNADAVLQMSYTGFNTMQLKASEMDEEVTMEAGAMLLDEVVVIGYGTALIQQDNASTGAVLTAEHIESLPKRKINALAAKTAGISVSDEGDALSVRGSRNLATDYYVDGVRVSAAVPGAELLLNGSGIRSEFRDYGFWETDLITDKNGEAFFTVTFPDDITQWETFVLGMDDRKRAGAWYGQTAAFKPVLAQLYLPRFLLPGDEVELVGSSVNYTNDTFNISTQLEVDGAILRKEQHQLIDGVTDKVNYTVTAGLDSLTAIYSLETGNYQDGEERSIPLFKVGTEETLGSFHRLKGDTSIELSFRAEDGPITIYAEPDMLRLMVKEMDALIGYSYGCNEQSASRLLALLMRKEVQQTLGETFEEEEAIQKMVALLRQRQLPDGSWGWWGGSPRNQWMTSYVLRALYAAKQAGYATEAYEKGMLFLTNQLSQLEGRNRLEALALFSDVGQNMDYESLLSPYDTLPGLNWTTLTATLIRAQQDLSVQLDTVEKYRQTTLFDGHYWGSNAYGFYDNQIQYSLLAYRIYKEKEATIHLSPIQQFFLEERHRGPAYDRRAGYRNTFEAAQILRTILPDLLEEYRSRDTLDFEQSIDITTGESVHWDKLPQQLTLDATQAIQINKTGVGQTYLTAYQQRWNPQPDRVEGPFVVTSSLWQENRQTERLEQSRPAQLKVELTVEKQTEYVLIEVPIPAGCSYGRKTQQRWRRGETYREYFRDKVAIFCERLEPGDYTYYVELEPRFNGTFQLNPAKAEQMYFPVFFGREGMKEVRVKGSD